MAASQYLVSYHGRNRAARADRKISLHQIDPHHIAALPPAIVVMPQDAKSLPNRASVSGYSPEVTRGVSIGTRNRPEPVDVSIANSSGRTTRAEFPALAGKAGEGPCSISRMSAIGVTPPIASLVKFPSFSESAPASLPSKYTG